MGVAVPRPRYNEMTGLRLYKYEKLCSRTSINRLFREGDSTVAFPLRVVYRLHEPQGEAPVRFLITIPKKKMRRAVWRVLLRRRTREAYRLNRHLLYPTLTTAGMAADLAFLYIGTSQCAYSVIEQAITTLLQRVAEHARQSALDSQQP